MTARDKRMALAAAAYRKAQEELRLARASRNGQTRHATRRYIQAAAEVLRAELEAA